MVKGLDLFRDHFRDLSGQYVLIGGTACSIAMENFGLVFRATKDLDIVLCVESLDARFSAAFWEFINAGGYQIQEKADGSMNFYRFQRPEISGYPAMLELFSRNPDAIALDDESRLTPIPINEQVVSLSAILLDKDYYTFLHSGKKIADDLPYVGPEHLIPLKAKAWLDLNQRRADGESIDNRDINKHRNDIFRLYQIIDPETDMKIPQSVLNDLRRFFELIKSEDIDLKNLGLRKMTREDILHGLSSFYGLD